MSADELDEELNRIVEGATGSLEKTVTQTQRRLLDEMQTMLSRLELDSNGNIIQNQTNRKILGKLDTYYDRAFRETGYYNKLNDFAGNIVDLTKSTNSYFGSVLDTFTPDSQYVKALQKDAIGTIETLLANDGLEAQLKQPLRQILSQNINSGATYADMLKQVRQFIIGNADREGQLLRYSKQISTDALFNYSRALQESIATKSGLQFAVYSGGIIRDSRDFCRERTGNYYHKKEVEQWARLDWTGKRAGTTSSTIFIYAGGYNCSHSIIYVSESVVPKEVIERAKDKGYYQE